MRIGWLWTLLLATCLLFATAGVAWAHVRVLPEEVPADTFEVFTVRVPTEEEIPTTGVRVEVPEGFTVTGVQPLPGWQHEFERDSGLITAIIWSGGEIASEEFQQFAFQARTPEETGQSVWKAFQTYEDGSVVEWTGPPDAEEGPASAIDVVSNTTKTGDRDPENQSSERGSGFTPIAAYGGLGLGALALVVALLTLRAASRNS